MSRKMPAILGRFSSIFMALSIKSFVRSRCEASGASGCEKNYAVIFCDLRKCACRPGQLA